MHAARLKDAPAWQRVVCFQMILQTSYVSFMPTEGQFTVCHGLAARGERQAVGS